MMSDARRERRARILEVASSAVMALVVVSGVEVDGMEEAQMPSAKEEPHSISDWLVDAMGWTIVVWFVCLWIGT
jgi:hypothetical protein